MELHNSWGVGVQGEHVMMISPPGSRLTPFRAKVLAAYLVSMAEVIEMTQEQSEVTSMSAPFDKILQEVRNT